jgi:hypothetical protein
MPVTSYSRTPASNNSAPPNGAPEGMSPGSVNNTIRQIMTDIVNEAAKGAARVLGSVSGTNTITGSLSPALDAYSAEMLVVFTPANNNTGAATLNINGLGALDILKERGAALTPGDLASGVPAVVVLDTGTDDFFLLNPQQIASGTYTPTLTNTTNVSASTANTLFYTRVGSVVTISGSVSVTPAAASDTSTVLRMNLPIASDFTLPSQLGGCGRHYKSPVGIIAADASDLVEFRWYSTIASGDELTFSLSYRVL